MRFICVLPLFFISLAFAQFEGFDNIGGGLGNFGGVANNLGRAASNFGGIANNLANNVRGAVSSIPLLDDAVSFADFAARKGIQYASEAERAARETVFNARKSLVDQSKQAFASGQSLFEMGINAFADLTHLEFLKQRTGNRKSDQGTQAAAQSRQDVEPPAGNVPDSFDWREEGGVTPVKDQETCGSCWAFSSSGAIESHLFRKTGKLIDLSEQNLVDCGSLDVGLNGCDGGFHEYAFHFIRKKQGGIARGDEYVYMNKRTNCSYTDEIRGAGISAYAKINDKNEENMKEVIANLGPVACSINIVETLMLYKQGIYTDDECSKGDANHSVLIVGYGSEKGKDFWIVKNSWGDAWGEEGYFRLLRGENLCGIASECSFPIV